MHKTPLALLLGLTLTACPAPTNTPEPPPASAASSAEEADDPTTYSCPMHPDVTSATAGECPKCGMDLVAQDGDKDKEHEGHDHEH